MGSGKEKVLFACCHGDGPRLPTGPQPGSHRGDPSIPTVKWTWTHGLPCKFTVLLPVVPNPVATTAKPQEGQGFRKEKGTGLRQWLQTQ